MKKGLYNPCRFDWVFFSRPLLPFYCTLFLILYLPNPAFSQAGVEWVKSIAGKDYNAGSDISIDPQGNVLIASVYRDQIVYDSNPVFLKTSRGKEDISLLKTDASGAPLWIRTLGGPGSDRIFRMASDAEGNVYITGAFEKIMAFDGAQSANTIESAGKEDMFLAKYNAEGELQWNVRAGGPRSDQGIGLTCDQQGNVYVAGYFEETATFGADAPQEVHSNGQQDIYIARYNKAGVLDWVETFGGEKRDLATGTCRRPGRGDLSHRSNPWAQSRSQSNGERHPFRERRFFSGAVF